MKDICQKFLPYSPWDNRATSRLPGIQPLENKEMLFIKDEAFNAQMSYRDFLIKEKRSEVFYLNKESISAAQELLEFILNILKNNSEYKIYNDRVKRPDNKIIFLNEDNPIVVAGRLVQEDLLILKINKPLSRIHRPVKIYDIKVTKSVQRMFNNLQINKPLWRANWYLYQNPELFSPLSEEFSHTTNKDFLDEDFWVRVERQTLMRLPDTQSIIFGIHTYVVKKNNLLEDQVTSLKQFSSKNDYKD